MIVIICWRGALDHARAARTGHTFASSCRAMLELRNIRSADKRALRICVYRHRRTPPSCLIGRCSKSLRTSVSRMRLTIGRSPHWRTRAPSSGWAGRFGLSRRLHERAIANSNLEYEHDTNHRYADRDDIGDGRDLAPRHHLPDSWDCGIHQISPLLTARWRRQAMLRIASTDCLFAAA